MATRAHGARGRTQRRAGRARRRRVRPARLLRLGHRHPGHSTAWPPRGSAWPTSTPPPCARPPGPACSPGATTTAAAWAGWPTWPPATPGYWGKPPRENGFLSEILRANGYATYAVGKWHLSPEDETNMAGLAGHLAPRAGLRPLVRLPRRRDPPVRARPVPRQPRRAATPDRRGGLPPERGPGRPGHRVRRRPAGGRRRPPFFLYFCTGACHSPHQAPAEWIERYRGRFDEGWDAWRERTFARQLGAGRLPEGTVFSPRPPWVPAWDDSGRAGAGAGRAVHGVLRRLPLLHRRPDRPAVGLPRRPRARPTTRS